MKRILYIFLMILFAVTAGEVIVQGFETKQDGSKAAQAKGAVLDISLVDLKQAMADKNVVLIDCNGSESYAKGHIPGAIDLEAAGADLAKKLPNDKAALVVSYCAGPKCPAYKAGADAAAKLGYTNVKYFSGGIFGWKKAHEKVETTRQSTEATDKINIENEGNSMIEEFKQRIDYKKSSPAALKAISALSEYLKSTELDAGLLNLVFMRASQLNGCAYCLNMHIKDAKAAGVNDQRLNLLSVWRESPVFTDRERAALAWTESVTLVAETHVPDEVYEIAKKQFSEKELVDLTIAIIAINGWNRLNIAFKTPVVCDIN